MSGIPPYVFQEDHEIVRDYATFSGRGIAEVARLVDDFRKLSADEWNAHPGGSWREKAATFYGASWTYVFDLLRTNPSPSFVEEKLDRFEPRLLPAFRENRGRRLLEFGGGTGAFCQLAASWGKRPTYLDVPGHVADFARWRFTRHHFDVELLLVDPGAPLALPERRQWDLLFSDAVLEHVTDPEGTARTLASAVAPGGFFGLLVDLEDDNPELPMHRSVDLGRVHAALRGAGLVPRFGEGLFVSGWDRP